MQNNKIYIDSDIKLLQFPLTRKQIEKLTADNTETLILLDKNGLIPGKDENFSEFRNRLLYLEEELSILNKKVENENIEKHQYLIPELKLTSDDMIGESLCNDTSAITENYSFSLNWAPGFFASKSIGFLAGGATLISETGFPVFIIKSAFKNKTKWFLYQVSELLSHEACHVARTPLNDNPYEEFFAYKLSPSRFRRYFGSFFHSPIDSLIMLIPFLLLLTTTLINIITSFKINEIYFWILCIIFPMFLYFRNRYFLSIFRKASKTLSKITNIRNIDSILFRSTTDEMKALAKLQQKNKREIYYLVRKLSSQNLRWKIIKKRFIDID